WLSGAPLQKQTSVDIVNSSPKSILNYIIDLRRFYRTAEQGKIGNACYTLWILQPYRCFLMYSKVQEGTPSTEKRKEASRFIPLFAEKRVCLMTFTLALRLHTTTFCCVS